MGLHVIPVIDVKGGVVVAARAADRANYQPITTPLATGCDPVDVVRGFLELYPFETVYVADLDAIDGRGSDARNIGRLRDAFPGVAIWVDSGVTTVAAAAELLGQPHIRVVVGSESVKSMQMTESLLRLSSHHSVLSLDLDGEGFRGPYELLTSPETWPRTVIAMSIASVGQRGGPALEYVRDVRKLAGRERHVYAGGGVRDVDDCAAARAAGADGVLVSTALHRQKIKADDLTKIAGL